MIAPNRNLDAIKAVHELLIKSREIAHNHQGEEGELFKMLDAIEYLVTLIMESGNSTEEYQKYLELLLNEDECLGARIALQNMKRDL